MCPKQFESSLDFGMTLGQGFDWNWRYTPLTGPCAIVLLLRFHGVGSTFLGLLLGCGCISGVEGTCDSDLLGTAIIQGY